MVRISPLLPVAPASSVIFPDAEVTALFTVSAPVLRILIAPLPSVVMPFSPPANPIVSAWLLTKLNPPLPAYPASVRTVLLALVSVTEPASARADSDHTLIVPLWVILPSAEIKLSALPFPPLIAAFMRISLAALRVRGVSLDHEIGSTTVMVPAPVPLALVVDTVTEELASVDCNVATVSRESLTVPEARKGEPADAEVSAPTMPAAVAEA